MGVGKFEIGVVSMKDILGSEPTESLERFQEIGLGFHSNQGEEITEIIVSGATFSTKEGIRVGTSAEEVRDLLGPPLSETTKEVNKGLEFPVLVYEGIGFFIEEGKVSYIFVAS
ncbi:MAG: hypothetical protein COA70_08605 [Planctomycetota bacterium]|nr:MAG: hypothetical protein COA70_08605 [Planctomycetota bacterium]